MSVINVQMLKGRTPEKACELIHGLSEVTVKVLGVPESVLLVALSEVAPEHCGVSGRSMPHIRRQAAEETGP
jgi:4-oxalocrotonate tautomerase family enzyme